MLLHAKSHKFHIGNAQNGATVQHIHIKQDTTTSCPNSATQQFGARYIYATAPKHDNKRHGCEIDMILNKHELRAHPKTCWNTIKQAWQDSIS